MLWKFNRPQASYQRECLGCPEWQDHAVIIFKWNPRFQISNAQKNICWTCDFDIADTFKGRVVGNRHSRSIDCQTGQLEPRKVAILGLKSARISWGLACWGYQLRCWIYVIITCLTFVAQVENTTRNWGAGRSEGESNLPTPLRPKAWGGVRGGDKSHPRGLGD